jgi:predicted transcriptional regulator
MTVVGYKKYNFNYHDVSGSNTAITGRYFLTKLQQRNIITPNDQDSVLYDLVQTTLQKVAKGFLF